MCNSCCLMMSKTSPKLSDSFWMKCCAANFMNSGKAATAASTSRTIVRTDTSNRSASSFAETTLRFNRYIVIPIRRSIFKYDHPAPFLILLISLLLSVETYQQRQITTPDGCIATSIFEGLLLRDNLTTVSTWNDTLILMSQLSPFSETYPQFLYVQENISTIQFIGLL